MTRIFVIWGQGGFLTSLGMHALANQITARFGDRVYVTEHRWYAQQEVVDEIMRMPKDVKKIIVGYSLGANAIPPIAAALNLRREIVLAVAYDPSIWSPSSRVITPNVKRCIVYHGTGWSWLGHALFTGPTVETLNAFDLHEIMDFDQFLHNRTMDYIAQVV